MLYIFETEIFNKKPIYFSLQRIYGIGKNQSSLICRKLGFSKNLITSELSKEQVFDLVMLIEKSNLIITNELKKLQVLFLRNLVNIKSYKGLRRIRGLPVKGQRTHTNGKTAKRLKKTFLGNMLYSESFFN